MATIAAMPDCNFLSHTSRVLEIALELRKLGHDVVFAGEGKYCGLIREAEFDVQPAKTNDPDHTLRCSRSGRVNWWDYERLKEGVAADLEAFEVLKPDLVIGDFRLSLAISAERAGISFASIVNASWTNYYRARHRAPEHLAFTRLIGRPLATLILPAIKGIIVNVDARPYRKLRKELGLDPRGNIWDQWRGDLTLLADLPEYGPTEGLPEGFHYIGPIVWEPRQSPPAWLGELDPDRPTLYVTMGSTGDPRYMEHAIELFGETEYQCMMTTAGLLQRDSYPANFFVCDYAPGSALMQVADLVVCQGGNGTVYQAMAAGVPVLGIPTMHDQEFNLDRVTDLGFGLALSDIGFRPKDLVTSVARILGEPRFRERARRLSDALSTWNGPERGAAVVHEYLQQDERPS